MSKKITCTVTDKEFEIIKVTGLAKGLKPSELLKVAIFSYINKYPPKGLFAQLYKNTDQKNAT